MHLWATARFASAQSTFAAAHRLDESTSESPPPPGNGDRAPIECDTQISLADPACDLKKTAHLTIRPPAATFRDIGPNRSRRTTELAGQTVRLFFRECRSHPVYVQSHFVCLPPYLQLLEISYEYSSTFHSIARSSKLEAHSSEALHKILARHLAYF